jgi:hypothetical protein
VVSHVDSLFFISAFCVVESPLCCTPCIYTLVSVKF